MKYTFNFPDIGEGITEGVIVEWKVEPGSKVETGDPLVEMETDKIVTDIPSPRGGEVIKTYGEAGDTIEVDSPLVDLEIEEEEEAFGVVGTSESSEKEGILPPSDEGTETPQKTKKPRGKAKATPVARSYAKELGVDINNVEGTGNDGRVTKTDILESTKGADKAAAKKRTEEVQLSSIRKTIAKNMLESTRSAAHMSLFEEAEISELVEVRERYKDNFAEQGIRLTYLPFFIKALTRALADFPVLNSEMDMEHNKLIYKNYYNIGVAMDTEEGLVVPVIRDVDTKDISQIAGEVEEKAQKARDRTLSLDDFKDGTFTITSYGSIGGLWGTAVINYPQAGILGIGRIHEQPVVREGEITVGTVLPVSLTVDHRIVDGGSSTRFMNTFLSYVSSPMDMFIR